MLQIPLFIELWLLGYLQISYLLLISEPAVKACPSLNDFNYREHVTTTSWGNEPTVTLWVGITIAIAQNSYHQ